MSRFKETKGNTNECPAINEFGRNYARAKEKPQHPLLGMYNRPLSIENPTGTPPLSHKSIREGEIRRSQEKIKELGERPLHWDIYDSFLTYGYSYEYDFKKVVPDEHWEAIKDQPYASVLKTYIENILSSKRGVAVGVELGGPGVRLFESFSKDFFQQTAGICLDDNANDPPRSYENRHTIVRNDILTNETKQQVKTWLKGGNIDLLIERMAGAIHNLPKEPFFMAKEAEFWYENLAIGGLIFAQIPYAFHHSLRAWEKLISSTKHASNIEVQTDNASFPFCVVRIRKLTDAPLPLLDAREVIKTQRKKGNFRGTHLQM